MAVVKEAEFKKCGECGSRKRIGEEVRGCDVCKTEFGKDGVLLQIDIFRSVKSGADHIDCCSWRCVFEALPTVDCDHFVSLPYLHYDDAPEGARASDFFAALIGLSRLLTP